MNLPRFLVDNDLDDHIVQGVLRPEPAVEFVRARDLGLDLLRDEDLLAYASTHGFALVSHDVNTMVGHAYQRMAVGKPMTGLFVINQFEPVARVIDSLILIWAASEAEEWHERVEFLPF